MRTGRVSVGMQIDCNLRVEMFPGVGSVAQIA